MMSKPEPISLFISYAHEDEPLRKQLETHLSLLQRQDLISTWQDRRITAGTDWAQEIDEHLNHASIILLLISADFLANVGNQRQLWELTMYRLKTCRYLTWFTKHLK